MREYSEDKDSHTADCSPLVQSVWEKSGQISVNVRKKLMQCSCSPEEQMLERFIGRIYHHPFALDVMDVDKPYFWRTRREKRDWQG